MPNQFLSPEGDLENYFVSEYWLIDQWVGDTLWGWGSNYYGGLGNGYDSAVLTPVTTFEGGSNWKQVSTGGSLTAAIKTDGTLWVWGYNRNLGIDTYNSTNIKTPVTTFAGGTNWKQVSCGDSYGAAIKTDGTLWLWGLNYTGALGTNDTTNRPTPVTTFAGGTNWKQVACGQNHTAAIKTDGTLWTWGYNIGQLGNNNSTVSRSIPVTTFAGGTNWKQVTCGSNHTAAIKTDGTLWTWGYNSNGQLGDNTTTTRSIPVTTFLGGINWKSLSVVGMGNSQSNSIAAIKTDGTLWTWGFNNRGQLGNNTTTNRFTPVTTFLGGTNWKQVSLGYANCAAIKTDGTLWTWGLFRLGGNTSIDKSTPVTTFAGGTNWKQVATGFNQALAITSGTDPTFFIA